MCSWQTSPPWLAGTGSPSVDTGAAPSSCAGRPTRALHTHHTHAREHTGMFQYVPRCSHSHQRTQTPARTHHSAHSGSGRGLPGVTAQPASVTAGEV